MKFCLDDGAVLVEQIDAVPAASPADATLHLPGAFAEQPPTVRITEPPGGPRSTRASMGVPAAPAVSGNTYHVETRRRGGLLWVVGALIIGIAAVAVALIVTRNRVPDSSSQIASASPAPTISDSSAAATPVNTTRTGNAATSPVPAQSRNAAPSPSSEKKTSAVQTEPARTSNNAPPPAPEKSAPRAPISSGVLNGKAVNLVKPAYPPIARSANASGTVTVQVTIDENGSVISAHAVSGHPLLQSAAVSAARASKFNPTMLSGQPVKVTGVIVYNFVAQ
jgi:TonB family protein